MKYTIIALTALAFQLTSCSEQEEKTQDAFAAPVPSDTTCYSYEAREDEVLMQLVSTGGNSVTGTLEYDFNYKDRNDGTLKGKLEGDQLIADYTFRSEGLTSVRQVVFRKEGDTWVEGYGETEEVAGKQVFKDISTLKYNAAIRLKPISCR